jgi:hypothetical protein
MSFRGKLETINIYKIGAFYSILLGIIFTGCTTVKVIPAGMASGPVEQGDSIAVVLNKNRETAEELKSETNLCECLKKALRKADIPIGIIPSDEFRRSLFPNLDANEATKEIESMTSFHLSSDFQQKIDSMRLRYLVIINEETSAVSSGEADFQTGSGGVSVTQRTSLNARIIDTKYNNESDTLNINVESEGFYGATALIIPVILPPRSTSKACDRFGKEVVTFIMSGEDQRTAEGKTVISN